LGAINPDTPDFESIVPSSAFLKALETIVLILQNLVAHSDTLSLQVSGDMDDFSNKLLGLFALVGSRPTSLDALSDSRLSGPTL
jgi:hypothetical protein